jgi:hypothetical protein
MARREAFFALSGAAAAAALVSAVWSLRPLPRAPVAAPCVVSDEESSLRAANANLVSSLQDCDRELEAARDRLSASRSAVAVAAPPPRASAPAEAAPAEAVTVSRSAEPTKEDLDRWAEKGFVRVRAPCLLDQPWTPSGRALDRLGLAPGDAQVIHELYQRSNRRLAAEILPLCSRVLGGAKVAVRIGPKVCADAVMNWARDADPGGTKAALQRVAGANAGRGQAAASPDAPPVEQLLVAMSREMAAFEADLAATFGPEEGKRLAWAPEMCTYRASMRSDNL